MSDDIYEETASGCVHDIPRLKAEIERLRKIIRQDREVSWLVSGTYRSIRHSTLSSRRDMETRVREAKRNWDSETERLVNGTPS